MDQNSHLVKDALLGYAIGDALGLPVEFKSRSTLKENPVIGMMGQGTHNQPAGTWSDDSALAFITAESLSSGYDLDDYCEKLKDWYFKNYWTPHGRNFHSEVTTRNAIERLNMGVSPMESGASEDFAIGNGALMRILPLAFFTIHDSIDQRFERVKELTIITHGHEKSVLACFIYLIFCQKLIEGKSKLLAYKAMQDEVFPFVQGKVEKRVTKLFDRVLQNAISNYHEEEIKASSNVVNTLEAVLWSFIKSKDFSDSVLKAVNLGDDTDTTAALNGALAGIFYGSETIPEEWLSALVKISEIEALAEKFSKSLAINTKS